MKLRELIKKLERYADIDPDIDVQILATTSNNSILSADIRHIFIGKSFRLGSPALKLSTHRTED